MIEDFKNGATLEELLLKYDLKLSKLKKIICKSGICERGFFVKETYEKTLDYIEKSKGRENAGKKWFKTRTDEDQ